MNQDNNLRKKNERNRVIIAILLLIAIIGVGYAALGANLKINGVADIPASTWNVHFKTGSITPTEGSVSIDTSDGQQAATIDNATQVSYAVKLALPGDFYEFTVDVENTGSIDAMLDSISSKLKIGNGEFQEIIATGENKNLPDYLDYSVAYSDGTPITAKQLLAANGGKETIKVRLAFKTDIESTDLPGSNQTLTFNLLMNYVQKDNTAIVVPHPADPYQLTPGVYSVSEELGYYGLVLPTDNIAIYSSIDDPSNNDITSWFDHLSLYDIQPTYLKHVLDNDHAVSQSYIEFQVKDELKAADDKVTVGTYELRGGIDESSLSVDDRVVFNKNVMILNRAFGEDNCNYSYDEYSCFSSSDNPSLFASINLDGTVTVGANGDYPHCCIASDSENVYFYYCYS